MPDANFRILMAAERHRLLAMPIEAGSHAKLLADLPFLDDVQVEPVGADAPEASFPLRVVCWNAERGRRLDDAARRLRATVADVYLLSELDWGMARSGNLHTSRELATRVGAGFAYGVEFIELGLGDERERRLYATEANTVGYHGAAILSRHALDRPRVVRLERSGSWFDGAHGERRIGGRIAVVAELSVADTTIILASVHLESNGDPAERCDQLDALFDAIDATPGDHPVVIGGDLNTSSLSADDIAEGIRLQQRIREDPARFAHPQPHEPLFEHAESRGYDWRGCNDVEASTHRLRSPSRRSGAHLDWFLTRGLRARDPAVIDAVDDGGEALSDHELIAVTLELAPDRLDP